MQLSDCKEMINVLLFLMIHSCFLIRLILSSGMSGKSIVFVTGNEGKLKEVKEILQPHINFNLDHENVDLNEYQGEVDDICIRKCQDAYAILKRPVIVEDVSLCFNALGGLPGPYIKWFLKKIGPTGLHRILLDFPDKSCVAVCIFGFADETGRVKLFRGETHGTVVSPRGSLGFGWDSCFQPNGFNETYAEMSPEIKNQISHRYKALTKLKEYFANKE